MPRSDRIDAELARALIAEQFPNWSDLRVAEVPAQGWDNRTFRLGAELSIRLPSAERYAAAIEKEDLVLPLLAPNLPLPIPKPVATGVPTKLFPFPWSVRRWIPGRTMTASPEKINRRLFAHDLADFLAHLHSTPTHGGPAAGRQSFFRGSHLSAYSDEVDQSLRMLADRVDAARCREVWFHATTTVWRYPPVWVHGDLDLGNLLVRNGRLTAAIDFGCCAVGDPACDLALAWTFLSETDREEFKSSLDLDSDTWLRARAWVLWKSLGCMAGTPVTGRADVHARNLANVLHSTLP